MYGLAKIACVYKEARSFAAKQRKQYKQLLDRLYGGKGKWEEELQQSGQRSWPGIYHGTSAENADKIMQEGLSGTEKAVYREFGKGTFFGDQYTAGLYAKDRILDRSGTQLGGASEMIEKFKTDPFYNPENYSFHPGAMVRLSNPKDLKNSHILYPDVNKAMVFDLERGPFEKVIPSQISYLKDGYANKEFFDFTRDHPLTVGVDMISNQRLSLLGKKTLGKDYYNDLMSSYFDELEKLPKENTGYERRRVINDIITQDYLNILRKKLQNTPTHHVKHYGKIGDDRFFDYYAKRLNNDDLFKRREFFFKDTDIPPELLKR